MCTVVGMWIAGIPVADRAVLHLAASLREAELVQTAERLERAYDRESRIVALDIPDRDAILRVLEDCPEAWRAPGDAAPGARRPSPGRPRLAEPERPVPGSGSP